MSSAARERPANGLTRPPLESGTLAGRVNKRARREPPRGGIGTATTGLPGKRLGRWVTQDVTALQGVGV
jgi:hypothetical protein